MDIEAGYRSELIAGLGPSFICFEEVEIEHPVLADVTLRADVVAIPVDEELWGHALAFEVKCLEGVHDYSKWSAAIKQASDYVLGRIRSTDAILTNRRISAALVFPAPAYIPYVPHHDAPEDIGDRVMISGAFHCALHWRVGRAYKAAKDGLTLSFGPNQFWSARFGFTAQARNLLKNKRPVGSRAIDVCAMLDGFDAQMPAWE